MTTAPAAPAPLPEGLTPLPAGTLGTIVTFLEMRAPPADLADRLTDPRATGLTFTPLTGGDLGTYLAVFREVGTPWLWNGRLWLDPAALSALLDDPGISAAVVTRGTSVVGLVELDRRVPGETEIVYFGLVPSETGAGLGRPLMARLLSEAWRGDVGRVWLHTCTLDHPGALAFYRRQGFTPYAQAIEILPDPRLAGLLPRDAAPHIPLLG